MGQDGHIQGVAEVAILKSCPRPRQGPGESAEIQCPGERLELAVNEREWAIQDSNL
jgi:hypothetical protein